MESAVLMRPVTTWYQHSWSLIHEPALWDHNFMIPWTCLLFTIFRRVMLFYDIDNFPGINQYQSENSSRTSVIFVQCPCSWTVQSCPSCDGAGPWGVQLVRSKCPGCTIVPCIGILLPSSLLPLFSFHSLFKPSLWGILACDLVQGYAVHNWLIVVTF